MKKIDVKRLTITYILTVIFIIVVSIGRYPLSIVVFVVLAFTAIIIAKIKYFNDLGRFIIYGFLWCIILLCLFMGLLFIMSAFKIEILKKIMTYMI